MKHTNYFLILNLSILLGVSLGCSHSAQNSDDVKPEADATTVATTEANESGLSGDSAPEDLSAVPVPEPSESLAPVADFKPAPAHRARRGGRAASVQPTAETEKSTANASVATQDSATPNQPPSANEPQSVPAPVPAATPPSPASAFAVVPDAAASGEANEGGTTNPIFPYLIAVGLIAVVAMFIRRRGRWRI